MEYEAEQVAVGWFVQFLRRWKAWLILAALVIVAFLFRCLHLNDPNHYFIISPDSYFFHWAAQGIMAGEPPPSYPGGESAYALHSGLSYPLAYIAKAVSAIFHLSSAQALDAVCKFLPPVLGVISLIMVYLVAAKLYDRRVGLFSAFAWALMLQAVFIGAGGYLDRDGLSAMLILIGVMLFYLSRNWRFHIGERDVGWLVAVLVIFVVEALLYLEWSFMGPVLLLAILVVYSVVQILAGYFLGTQKELDTKRRLAAAVNAVNWRTFAVIIGVSIVILAASPQGSEWVKYSWGLVRGGGQSGVQELQGLSFRDLLVYNIFLIPMVLALYLAWKKRSSTDIFLACWFLVLLVLSLFSKRVLFYGAPAACLLIGVGLSSIWEWKSRDAVQGLKKFGVVVLFFLLILVSFVTSTSLATSGLQAPDQDWQNGLRYLREETPGNSIVMTQWGWGYWILDLGQRRPVVDNGYYSYNSDSLRDVGLAYATTEPSEAVQIMKKYGAAYIVFSKVDLDFAGTIMGWAGLGEDNKEFPNDSLIVRSLNGKFESGGGLEVIYRSEPNKQVVILGLTKGM